MGLLSTPANSDERLIEGAYISVGASLYRVFRRTASQIVLEDAYRSHGDVSIKKATTAGDIVRNYQLRRAA